MTCLWGKEVNSSPWVEWYRNIQRSAYPQNNQSKYCKIVIRGLSHLGRRGGCTCNHMWLWKREFSRSGPGRTRSHHPKQLCFWRGFLNINVILILKKTHTWFSGRTISSLWGVSNSRNLVNNQSLAANPPTSTTCWKYKRWFGNDI